MFDRSSRFRYLPKKTDLMTPQAKMGVFDRPEFDVATLDRLQLSEIEYYLLGLH